MTSETGSDLSYSLQEATEAYLVWRFRVHSVYCRGNGLGRLVCLDTSLTGVTTLHLLSVSSLLFMYLSNNVLFQQDNTPCKRVKARLSCILTNGLAVCFTQYEPNRVFLEHGCGVYSHAGYLQLSELHGKLSRRHTEHISSGISTIC